MKEVLTSTDSDHNTPLKIAENLGRQEVVELLEKTLKEFETAEKAPPAEEAPPEAAEPISEAPQPAEGGEAKAAGKVSVDQKPEATTGEKNAIIARFSEELSTLSQNNEATNEDIIKILKQIPSDLLLGVLERQAGEEGYTFLHMLAGCEGTGEILKAVAEGLTLEQLVGLLKIIDNGHETPLHWAVGEDVDKSFLNAAKELLGDEKYSALLQELGIAEEAKATEQGAEVLKVTEGEEVVAKGPEPMPEAQKPKAEVPKVQTPNVTASKAQEDIDRKKRMQKGKEIGKHYENLSKLLKKTKITTKSVNDVLEKIPSDLLPDVLKRKVGGCQFLHWAADDKHGGVFLEAVAGKLTEEQLLGLLKAEDNEQKTPLHWAAGSENGGAFLKAVAKRLSEEKLLEVLKMPSKSGEMFLRTVFNGPNPIGFLKAVAAKLTEEQLLGLLEIKDDGQKTPLHWVAWSKHGGVFLEAVAGKLTEEQLLGFLKAGDNGKKTPLHLAAGSWNEGGGAFLEAVAAKLTEEQLLGLLKAEDNEQKTPLHWAAWSKHGGVFLEAVVGKLTEEQLLGFLKAGDNGKKTPLHLAARSWNEGGGAFLEAAAAKLTEEQLLSLLEAGDNEQKTPLHLAAESKHGGAFLEALAKRLSEEKLLKVLKMPYGADEMLLHAVLKGPNMGGFLKAVARKLPKDQLIGLIKGAVGSRDEGVSLLLALNRVLSKEQLMEYLEIPDSSGFAPLHSAAQSGNKKFLDTVFAILKKYPEETIALFETQANGQKLIEIANETVKQDLEKALVEAQKYKEKRELVHAMFMNAFEEIKKVPGFQSCTLKQQAYIQTYAQQMIEGGDKAEFAIAVCANMVKLYQAKIDEKLPAKITKPERNSDGSFKLTQTIEAEAKAMETAVNELSQIMRKSGGDYRIMKDFLEKQIGSSECRQSQAMRYHWLTQRQNPEESSLWGREMPAWYRGLNKEDRKQARAPLNHTQRANLKKGIYPEWVNKLDGEDRKAAIKVMGRELFDEFPAYEIRNSGPAKTFSLEEMKAKFEKVCEKFYGGNQEKYAKTVAMHKAFVAVALDKIDFPGKNPETSTCTIDRVVNFERVSQTQSDYAQQRMQGTATIAHQIAESAAIGGPIEWCVGPGTDTHHFEVPVARIMVPYCCHLFKENSGGSSVNFWCEREFMCNFNGLSAEIVQN